MPVEFKKPELSLRELERAILLEAAGCAIDDEKAHVFTYSYQDCVLILQALAKKLLGLTGVAIGNNPTRPGFTLQRDFTEERRQVQQALHKDQITKGDAEGKLQLINQEERFANSVAKDQDPEAWNAVLELTEVLSRRAMALHRAGLVEYNVDTLVADEFDQRERQAGGTGSSPMEGAVSITDKGRQAVGAHRWPVPRKKQRSGVSRLDEDVELPR